MYLLLGFVCYWLLWLFVLDCCVFVLVVCVTLGSSRCFMVIGLVWVVACGVILVGLRLWEVWILWILCFGFSGYSCFVI